MNTESDDYDSPWKEILEKYFREFTEFFFPEVAEGIDWKQGYIFLDKELQQVVRDATLGRRLVDKLAQVWQKDGKESWVLAHVEIQGQEETDFTKRMFVYNYRIFDRYDKPVVSLAVLADKRKTWCPNHFEYKLWGCEMEFSFPVAKLTDYLLYWKELEKDDNPFALVVMAHLKTQETRHNSEDRRKWKLYLIKMLYKRGYKRQDIINLFLFIDWLMRLPKEAEQSLWEEMYNFEKEGKMKYISSIERIGFQKGKQEGRQEGRVEGRQEGRIEGRQEVIRESLLEMIEMGLSIRFGVKGFKFLPKVQVIEDIKHLKIIKEAIKTINDLDEIETLVDWQPDLKAS